MHVPIVGNLMKKIVQNKMVNFQKLCRFQNCSDLKMFRFKKLFSFKKCSNIKMFRLKNVQI
jgi:hypothetical protein